MTSAQLLSWGTWIIVAAAALLFVYAWRGKRTPGQRACPRCWYDMRGIAGLKCPECGKAARTERHLAKRRKRRRLAALALLLLPCAYMVSVTPRVVKEGAIGLVPTWSLILMTPWLAQPDEPPEWWLGRTKWAIGLSPAMVAQLRATNPSLSGGAPALGVASKTPIADKLAERFDDLAWHDRVILGLWTRAFARPSDGPLSNKRANRWLSAGLQHGVIPGWTIDSILREEARTLIGIQGQWENWTRVYYVTSPGEWMRTGGHQYVIRPLSFGPTAPWSGMGGSGTGGPVYVTPAPVGDGKLRFSIELSSPWARRNGKWESALVWSGTIEVPRSEVRDVRDVVKPSDAPSAGELAPKWLTVWFEGMAADGQPPNLGALRVALATDQIESRVEPCLEVQVLRDGKVMFVATLDWIIATLEPHAEGARSTLLDSVPEFTGWTVRVKGVPDAAIRTGALQYWRVDHEIPLSEVWIVMEAGWPGRRK